jgi:hypothetical protein
LDFINLPWHADKLARFGAYSMIAAFILISGAGVLSFFKALRNIVSHIYSSHKGLDRLLLYQFYRFNRLERLHQSRKNRELFLMHKKRKMLATAHEHK